MAAIVRIVDVVKNYHLEGGVVRALRGVSLKVEEGDFVALMGPSGSGKSTLLNVLGCLDRPTSGEYYLGDEEVAQMDDDQLSEIRSLYLGFIFQSYNLLPQYTLVENIEVPLLYQGRPLGRETHERCIELAGLVGLADRLGHRPTQLSGGQQQRVAIARAVVARPRLILADEPTGNLDTRTSIEVMGIFQRLNQERGITVVLITHEMDIAEYGTRIVAFRDGQVVADKPVTRRRLAKDELAALPPTADAV
jgi:putative ABC transport system ATP-binding protein